MADHSKDHLGGTLRHSLHSSKKHKSSENTSTTASQKANPPHSNIQKTTKSDKSEPSKKSGKINVHKRSVASERVEDQEASTSRSLRYSRRSKSLEQKKATPSKSTESVSSEGNPLTLVNQQQQQQQQLETPVAKRLQRKRSYPTPRDLDSSEFEIKSKRRRHTLESNRDRENTTEIPLTGIKAALRSNPQATLFSGLSPNRRKSSSKRSTTSVATVTETDSGRHSTTSSSLEVAVASVVVKATTSKTKQLIADTKKEKGKLAAVTKSRPGSKKRLPVGHSTLKVTETQASSSSSGQQQQLQPPQKTQKRKKSIPIEPGVLSRSKASKTTGSCASSRRRASVVVGSKQSAPTTSASTNSLTVDPSSVFKQQQQQSAGMSSGQDSDAQSSVNQGQAEGQEASVDGAAAAAATASAVPALGSFASLIQTLDQDSNDVGRLQALLESRGLPSQLFNALGPRMHQILHRSMIGGSASKAQQLLLGLQSKDEGQQLTAAIEMCQLLVMGNEDTLAGFPIKQVVPALIQLLQMEHNFDMMHNACRALTYMMEALPRSSAVVVEAVPVFLQRLQAIQCMDVAEQSLQALDMLSKKHNKAILHANGVLACLTYVDFFSISAQRAALAITANCCQNMTLDEFHYVKESLPMLSARLTQNDKKSLESVGLCMARLVDNYQSDERILKEIASHGLLTNIQQLLTMTSPVFSTGMFVTVIRMLVLLCANCPDLAVQLLKQNIAETLCFLLVGPSDQGASQTIELVSRTPQELYEIVCLIGELLPKLPRDGLFAVDSMLRKNTSQYTDALSWQWLDDHGLWHPYSLIDSRIVEAAHQSGEHEVSLTIFGGNYTLDFDSMQQINDDTGTARHVQRKVNSLAAAAAAAVPRSVMVKSDSREDALHEDTGLAATFIKTLFCILYEVYSSSAGPSVRHKCLQAIMRMIYYGSPELLKFVLPSCNVSSHLAAMMASNDLKVVVMGIQMANILMEKLPDVFNIFFCREGVMHQIKRLCESEVIDLSTKKETSDGATAAAATSTASAAATGDSSSLSVQPCSSKDPSLALPSLKKIESLQTSAISTEADKPSSSSPRLRLSSVLKHKKPPKRGAVGGTGSSRKSNKNDAGMEAAHAVVIGESSAAGTTSSSSSELPPPSRGKWNAPPKGSFLAGLHPSRWGRSSSMGPDRTYPPLPAQVGLSQILYTEAVVRPPVLPPRPHVIDNRDKIKQWIIDQAMKFSEKYFDVDNSHVTNHPALSSLNLLCSATTSLSNENQEIESMSDIADIITGIDMSPFEIIHSGLVGTLLTYLTAGDVAVRDLHLKRFLLVFLGCKTQEPMSHIDVVKSDSFACLVAKLMTCFHHLEQFQVKVHDLPGGATSSGRGSNALRFFDSHQLKCNLQRHASCTNLKQWRGGPVKIDPLALVQAIERYLIMRGYGRVRPNADNECSDDDDASDDDIDDTMAAVSLSQGSGRHRIEFLINDHVLPYNMTVYEAVKQFSNITERENNETDTESEYLYGNTGIWISTHTIWFRPASDQDGTADAASSPKKTKPERSRGRHTSKSNKEGDCPVKISPLEEFLTPTLPAAVTVKDPSLQVLALLRLLNAINRHFGTLFEKSNAQMLISCQEFMSSKLTAKANRQLQDPLVIMTGNIPQWLIQIGRACPFLLPFDTRLSLFYATTFDRDRAMHRLHDTSHEGGQTDGTERVAPRLERRKSIVSREDILKQAEKVLNDLGGAKAILEIQYENEVGTGLGPTLEFYTLVSKELQRMDLELWRGEPVKMNDQKGSDDVVYVYSSCGLFPSPISRTAKAVHVNKIKSKFRFLGRFMAKALMDSRMLDLPMSQAFYKWMLGHEQSLGPDDLYLVDPAVAKTFLQLQDVVRQKKCIDADKSHTAGSRRLALESLTVDGCPVEDLDLDFVLPGYPNIELKKGGKDIPLTLDNLDDYLKLVSHWSLVEGTRRQFESFREGFEVMFTMSSLAFFYPEEMDQLFCGNFHEPWTVKYLIESCRPDHGYNQESQAIKFLYEILLSYDADEQRLFIQFMTGSPRLPIGGLKSLTPPLTIVRKTAETNENPDDSLPSVMTCVNYLKLPEYSTLEIMRARLSLAAREGQLSFHLS